MRLLGIDYGTKKIGIALSDGSGRFAFAHSVVLNIGKKEVLEKIKKLCQENNVGTIILGQSLNFKGEPNVIMKKIEDFKINLEQEISLPVFYEDETFTSAQARRPLAGERARPPLANARRARAGKTKTKESKVDASAAALILKSYLDKNS